MFFLLIFNMFRVHRGLVLFSGKGPSRNWEPPDVKYGCLSLF